MPHIRNGHTWIANELIEQVFAKGKFSKRESQIIWVILRQSWGWLDKRPKILKKYGKEKRKYSITRYPISYTQFSEKTGIAIPHIGETIRGLKARNIIREHYGHYKFNKDYDSYQNSNLSYRNGNQGKEVTEMVSKSYRNGNLELPKEEPKVTKRVSSTQPKSLSTEHRGALKESKENLNKERKKILSPLDNIMVEYQKKFPEVRKLFGLGGIVRARDYFDGCHDIDWTWSSILDAIRKAETSQPWEIITVSAKKSKAYEKVWENMVKEAKDEQGKV